MSLIFHKLLKLHMNESLESQSITMMTSDVERIVSSMVFIHEIWAAVLEATLATWLLVRQLGVSSISVLGLASGEFREYISQLHGHGQ